MKLEYLLVVVIAGVILADMVANVPGTNALFHGFNMLWSIGTQPTNTSLIQTSTATKKGPK